MIDGAAWLKELRDHPGRRVELSHDQAVAIAQSLAGMQAMQAGMHRISSVIAGLGSAA